jgi:murein endopeptidase
MTRLELIEIDKKHDCPVGQYEKGCFDGEGSGQCLQCGMNNQRDADQQIYDTDIAALQQEVDRLKKERPLFTKNEVKHLLKYCQKDCANCDSPSSDSCKDIDRECMTFHLIGILGLLEAALSSKEEEK